MNLADFRQTLAEVLDQALPNAYGEHMGFALLIFRFDGPGPADYVSNAERVDMIKALRETADRLEAGQDIPRTAGEA